MPSAIPALASLALAAAAQAQGAVWTVGPGADFATVQGAVDAASDGDTILVSPAAEASAFDVSAKSLTIAGTGPGRSPLRGASRVRNLTSSQDVVLRGFETTVAEEEGLQILNCTGSVFVEDCLWIGDIGRNLFPVPGAEHGYHGLRVENANNVVLVNCTMEAGRGASVDDADEEFGVGRGGDGIDSTDSFVALYDCTLSGGRGGNMTDLFETGNGGAGGDGIELEGGYLFASGTRFEGADGGSGSDAVFGCGFGGAGGSGIRLDSGSPSADHLDSAFVTGQGGLGCGQLATHGVEVKLLSGSATALAGEARSTAVDGPVHAGETLQLTAQGMEGDFVLVLVSPAVDNTYLPAWLGLLVTGAAAQVVPLGAIGSSGALALQATLGPLPPGIDSLHLTVQGLFFTDPDLQLGAPSALVWVGP